MKANGLEFASLRPFKAVSELVMFQRLCASLRGRERGNTAQVHADLFKCAPSGCIRGKGRELREKRDGRDGETLADRFSD
jgi:hypothetical protein